MHGLAPHLSPPTQTHKTHTGVPLTVRRSGTRRWWMWLAQSCKSEEKLKDSPAKSPNETSTDREGLWWMGLALQVWWKNLQPPDCPHRPNKNLSRERSYINHIGEKVMSKAIRTFRAAGSLFFIYFTSFQLWHSYSMYIFCKQIHLKASHHVSSFSKSFTQRWLFSSGKGKVTDNVSSLTWCWNSAKGRLGIPPHPPTPS